MDKKCVLVDKQQQRTCRSLVLWRRNRITDRLRARRLLSRREDDLELLRGLPVCIPGSFRPLSLIASSKHCSMTRGTYRSSKPGVAAVIGNARGNAAGNKL